MIGRRSLTTRLITSVTLVAGAIIAAGLYLDYRIARERILEDLTINARSAVDGAVGRIAEMTTGVEASVRTVADALSAAPTPETTDRVLASLVRGNPHIAASALAFDPIGTESPEGRAPYRYRRPDRYAGELGRADLATAAAPYWEEPWYTLPREAGEARWIEPYFETTGLHAPMITFAAPLYRSSGSSPFFGVLTADVTLATLAPYLNDLALDSAGFGFLLSSGGVLIGAPEDDVIGQTISSVFPGVPSLAQSEGQSLVAPSGFTGSVPCPRDAGQCTLRLRPVDQGIWTIGIVYSQERLLEPLRSYALRTLAIGLIMLTLMAVLTAAITRRLTRPLINLADASGDVARGRLDVSLPQVRGDDEIAKLVDAFDHMRKDLATYIEEVAKNAAQRSRLEGEMAAAADIQRAMLPQGGRARMDKDGLRLWAELRPARAVGGDLYSFAFEGGTLRFAIGDVSDKGIVAALFMARAIALIGQWEAQDTAVSPGAALREMNHSLAQDNERCMFVTLTLGSLDLRSGRLRFASAGHPPPLLLRDGVARDVEQRRGPPLALADDLEFPVNELDLAAADRLVFYTDGFDEAQNPSDATFGLNRLQGQILASEDLPLDEAGRRLFRAVDTFAGHRDQHDDMTLLQIEVSRSESGAPWADTQSFALGTELVATTRAWLEVQGRRQGLGENRLGELSLVLEEMVCNVRNHSGLNADDELTLGLAAYPDRVELTCADSGKPFNPLTEATGAELGLNTEETAIGGLGVHLIERLTDAQSYQREGERNILRVHIARETTGQGVRSETSEMATPPASADENSPQPDGFEPQKEE